MYGLGVFSTFALHENNKRAASGPDERPSTFLANAGRVLLIATLAGFVAACGSTPKPATKAKFSPAKYGVKGSPKMVDAGEAVPKGGGRYMVGKKYKIAGKWYQPKEDPDYKNVGIASWYGPTFHGRKTANGEVFDRNGLTAAHTTMPLPSYARVTNIRNGRSMIVRVNDRGPFHDNRIIDLSERVADMLGTKQGGVAKVKVEYVGRARLDGLDEKYLMASYSGPDAVSPGGTFPGTQIADAHPQLFFGGAPAPTPRPYMTASASIARNSDTAAGYRIAFDPAAAFEIAPETVKVASANTFIDSGPAVLPTSFTPQDTPAVNGGFEGIEIAPEDTSMSSYAAEARIKIAHGVFDFARKDGLPLVQLAQR